MTSRKYKTRPLFSFIIDEDLESYAGAVPASSVLHRHRPSGACEISLCECRGEWLDRPAMRYAGKQEGGARKWVAVRGERE